MELETGHNCALPEPAAQGKHGREMNRAGRSTPEEADSHGDASTSGLAGQVQSYGNPAGSEEGKEGISLDNERTDESPIRQRNRHGNVPHYGLVLTSVPDLA